MFADIERPAGQSFVAAAEAVALQALDELRQKLVHRKRGNTTRQFPAIGSGRNPSPMTWQEWMSIGDAVMSVVKDHNLALCPPEVLIPYANWLRSPPAEGAARTVHGAHVPSLASVARGGLAFNTWARQWPDRMRDALVDRLM